MKNYNIENNIDFYKELYTSLDENNDNMIIDNNTNNIDLCLITNMPLKNNFVELQCGHKFNYEPLYKDILNHKKKFNNMEQIKSKLKQNQIRCPYCRNIQDELLPYYENLGHPKEHGVNFFDSNKSNLNNNYCEYINPMNQCHYQIVTFDSSGNSHSQQCYHYGYIHSILKSKYNNENKYCYNHRIAIIKELKEQEKIKKAKIIEEKLKMKMEFMQKKIELKNKKSTVSSENIIDTNFCNVLLKSGKFKGTQCSMSIYKECMCKRHYNSKNKNNTIVVNEINNENEENIVIG
jgi:hypothetical protein